MDNKITKNRKSTVYFLGLLVLAIWGYIIYLLFGAINKDDETKQETRIQTNKKQENLDFYRWKNDLTYDIVLNYPFSASQQQNTADTVKITKNLTAGQHEYIDPIAYLPAVDVQYLGFLENEKNKTMVAILQINGRQVYLSQGDQVDGIKLLKFNADQIRIRTSHQTISIDRQ